MQRSSLCSSNYGERREKTRGNQKGREGEEERINQEIVFFNFITYNYKINQLIYLVLGFTAMDIFTRSSNQNLKSLPLHHLYCRTSASKIFLILFRHELRTSILIIVISMGYSTLFHSKQLLQINERKLL